MALFPRGILICPRCKSDRVYASSPKPGDFLYRLIFKKPVRCQSCYHRFATWITPKKPEPHPTNQQSSHSGVRPSPLDPDSPKT